MNSIRQRNICDFIESNQLVTIKQLQELYPDVSLMTIHRDLDALVQSGKNLSRTETWYVQRI